MTIEETFAEILNSLKSINETLTAIEEAVREQAPREPEKSPAVDLDAPTLAEIKKPARKKKATIERAVEKKEEPAPEPSPKKVDFDELTAEFLRFFKTFGHKAAMEFLSEYGAERLTQISEDKWPKVYGDLKVRLAVTGVEDE